MCQIWAKNGGCKLDQHFNVDNNTQGRAGFVRSFEMFAFMQKTCLKSCGWAPQGKKIDNKCPFPTTDLLYVGQMSKPRTFWIFLCFRNPKHSYF